MPYRNHRRASDFRRELEQTMRYHRQRAGAFKTSAARHSRGAEPNAELHALRLKIAKVYDDLADVIENRLFKEW